MSGAAQSPELYLTIEELATRLKLDPTAVKELLAEVAAELTKEYLTIDELAKRLSLDKKTVKNKMAAGIFRKGIHYFSPPGLGPRFKWSAIQALIEGGESPLDTGIPMRRGYKLKPAISDLWKKTQQTA